MAEDANTKYLIHCDGADASTTFTDELGHTVTRTGNGQVDTAQSKFGGAAYLGDGSGDNVSIADHADLDVGTGNWTIDFWLRWNGTPNNCWLFHKGHDSPNSTYTFMCQCWPGSNWIYIQINNGGTVVSAMQQSWTPSADTWYHLAFVRSGTSLFLFIDGVKKTGDMSYQAFASGAACPTTTDPLKIGSYQDASYSFKGWIDEIRISKGTARWTADFTPPTEAYTVSTTAIKSINGLAKASVKSHNGLAIASVKSINGLA